MKTQRPARSSRTPRPARPAPAGALLLLSLSALSALACDKDPPKPEPGSASSATASAAAATTSAPSTPAAPAKVQLAVDDNAVFVAGERLEVAPPDLKGRVTTALGDKPVAGETIVLNAARDTKLPKVSAVVSALVAKKAKGVEIHTPRRDRSGAEVIFVTNMKPADCSAVGYIAKDGAISTWPASGATAERFSRGMAGPDLTRGSEGVRKRLLSCDAPVWFVGADESMTWGLAYDLVLAVTGNEDGGTPLAKPRSVSFLTKTPVPGRKIETELVE